MTPISAIIITYNVEDRIERTLQSVEWCDEIVVVDSGSTDATLDICRKYGCKLFHKRFEGFGEQKQHAADVAQNHWILCIDSDETVTPGLREEIENIFSGAEPGFAAYRLPRSMIFMGRTIRSEYKKPNLMLFDRRKGKYDGAKVHEKIIVDGKVGTLKGEILHYSYADIEEYFVKFNRYTSLAAEELHKKGKSRHPFIIALRVRLDFARLYVLKGNFLSGFPGYLWSLFSAMYPAVKYAKAYEESKTVQGVLK